MQDLKKALFLCHRDGLSHAGTAKFIFDDQINSTSPGQACVFYLKDQVLGGGWITKTSS